MLVWLDSSPTFSTLETSALPHCAFLSQEKEYNTQLPEYGFTWIISGCFIWHEGGKICAGPWSWAWQGSGLLDLQQLRAGCKIKIQETLTLQEKINIYACLQCTARTSTHNTSQRHSSACPHTERPLPSTDLLWWIWGFSLNQGLPSNITVRLRLDWGITD